MDFNSYSYVPTYVDFSVDSAKTNSLADYDSKAKTTRKKFAVPPVKVACLEW